MNKENLKYIVGAYATAPSLASESRELEQEFYNDLISEIPSMRGLEIPFWGECIHQFGDDFLLNIIRPKWENVLSCIPGTMNMLAKNAKFGLASDDERSRTDAVLMHKRVNHVLHRMKDMFGERSVIAVQIATAPSTPVSDIYSSKLSLSESLEEIISWDWGVAKIVIEHCDTASNSKGFEKGFLSLEDEIDVLQKISKSHNVGITINWARSAIEGRSVNLPVDHIKLASQNKLLAGVMFSGVSKNDEQYGVWKDTHMPFAKSSGDNDYFEKNSLLTEENIISSLNALEINKVDYLGVKILAMPIEKVSIKRRVGVNRESISILDKLL